MLRFLLMQPPLEAFWVATWQIVDLVLLAFGLLFIVAVLAASRRLDSGPIRVQSEKIGTLEIPFVAFLVLLGVTFAGVGEFFRWKDYETRLAEADAIHRKLDNITEELERFKIYEVNVEITLHDEFDRDNLRARLYRKKPFDANFTAGSPIDLKEAEDNNVLIAKISDLNPGDDCYLVISEEDHSKSKKEWRTWKTERFRVPVIPLQTKLQGRSNQ